MTAAPRLRILFCADPFDVRQPDPGYASEVATASELGIEYDLLHFEALVDEQNNGRAVRCVPEQPEPALVVYRGWMLRPAQYTALEAALA